jgi:hypothetical protein
MYPQPAARDRSSRNEQAWATVGLFAPRLATRQYAFGLVDGEDVGYLAAQQ